MAGKYDQVYHVNMAGKYDQAYHVNMAGKTRAVAALMQTNKNKVVMYCTCIDIMYCTCVDNHELYVCIAEICRVAYPCLFYGFISHSRSERL